jgi:hypothetical protein
MFVQTTGLINEF